MNDIEQQLKKPFPASDIEFRIARVFKNNQKAVVLAYITSRAVMDRLDDIFGVSGWVDSYEVLPTGVLCKLSVLIEGEWICKQDTAQFTNIEALKGGFSDSLKRAAVKFGIGRYLYNLPEHIVELHRTKPYNIPKEKLHTYYSKDISAFWIVPELPSWARSEKAAKLETQISELPADYPKESQPSTQERNEMPTDSGSMRILLLEFIDSLYEQKALTEKRFHEYKSKVKDPGTGFGLLKFFYNQFQSIDKLYSLIRVGAIEEDEGKAIYKNIMTANSSKLSKI